MYKNALYLFIKINSIYEETQNLKQLNEEDHQKLLKDLESKSTSVAELENEVMCFRCRKVPHF